MHLTELFLVFTWLISLPVLVGLALLRVWHARGPTPGARRFLATAVVFIILTTAIAFAFLAAGPTSLGHHIGVRDVAFFGVRTMWAPFAYIAAIVALPVAGWLSHRGTTL